MVTEEWKRSGEDGLTGDEIKRWWHFWPPGKGNWLLIAAAALAILVLLWPSSSSPTIVETREIESGRENSAGAQLSRELAELLSQVEGAGQVEVSISLASAGERVYARNEREDTRQTVETDRNGGERNTQETSRQGDLALANGAPLLLDEMAPVITGVLVLADGAGDLRMQEKLTDLTAVLLDLSPHQVRVAERKGE